VRGPGELAEAARVAWPSKAAGLMVLLRAAKVVPASGGSGYPLLICRA
jgi:hypothetical protein